MPEVSVIIATRSREQYLRDLLSSLCFQSFKDFEVIIVYDSGVPLNREKVESIVQVYSNKLEIKLLHNSRNLGVPISLNRGASVAAGKILVFTDDDCIADKDWLLGLVKWYSNQNVGGVGGRVVPVENDAKWIPNKTNFVNITGKLNWDGDLINNFELGSKTFLVDFLSGANMSFRKNLFRKVGGFSSIYGGNAYRFETDLSLRIRNLGFRLVYDPNAIVFHRRADNGGCRVSVYDWNYWLGRNHILFVLRCLRGKVFKVFLFAFKHCVRILMRRRACPYGKPRKWEKILWMFFKGLLDGVRIGIKHLFVGTFLKGAQNWKTSEDFKAEASVQFH